MRLNLRDIINIPGASVTFDYEPDLSEVTYDSVSAVKPGSRGKVAVKHSAGVLKFSADVEGDTICTCARCLKEFENPVHQHIETLLSDGERDDDDPDVYLLKGDEVDVDEIIFTDFILSMDQRLLCREDCKGLCPKCGADLNNGPCTCKSEIDPRLAALRQFTVDE
jgi:uncharacterized protein